MNTIHSPLNTTEHESALVLPGDAQTIAACDELSLWSAPFGLMLLETVKLLPGMRVLDIGCGTGFPLLELASRLGPMGHVWGLDPWAAALKRARSKARALGITNIELVEGCAEAMPFEDHHFDLLVSNNGLNNVSDVKACFGECSRVARSRAQLVMTVNLPGTFALFYELLEMIFEERRWTVSVEAMRVHIASKSKPLEEWKKLLEGADFTVRKTKEYAFTWSFMDGRALFNHWFIRLFFLNTWRELVPEAHRDEFMGFLQGRLNRLALERGGLHLEVPYVCLDACRN